MISCLNWLMLLAVMLLIMEKMLVVVFLFFFFQAEDGIRDRNVTGVQTCALPISERSRGPTRNNSLRVCPRTAKHAASCCAWGRETVQRRESRAAGDGRRRHRAARSEERRVGKECRPRRSTGR